MNYQNLENEINEYSTYFRYCDSILSKFSLFFKEFNKSGTKFIVKIKKLIDDIYTEINKEQFFISTLNKNLKNFCDDFKEMMDKLESFFTRIEKDIIEKIIEFDKDYKNSNKSYIAKLIQLNNYLLDNKNKLEKVKNNYFDSCKTMSEYDKKNISNNTKEKKKEEELVKFKEQLEKLKQISETKKVYYRIEVTKINDLLLSNENTYSDIINLINKKEEERGKFYIKILLLFINGIKEYNFENKESITRNEKYIDDIFVKRDLKMFSLFFSHLNNNKEKNRFLYEEFLDFENFNVIKNNKNNILSENKNNIIKDNPENIINDNDIKEIKIIDYNFALKMIELGKEPFIDIDTMDNNFIELDNIIFNLIQRDEKINDEKFLRIINFIDENVEGSKNFIFLLMGHYCGNNFVQFNNLENIYLLNSVLNMIINYIWENKEYNFLSFLILYIGEKTIFYSSKDNFQTNYLCKIMSKNTIYHTNDFWYKIINLKIKLLAKIKINEEFQHRRKNSISKKDGKLISGIGKIFGGKEGDNQELESEILYSQIYKEKSSDFCTEILSEYISHFTNYDYIEENTSTLIERFAQQYDLNIKQKKYFLKILDSNNLYQKGVNPYFSDNKLDIKKYKNQEDLNKLYLSFNSNKKFKNIGNDSKIKILLFSMKYLNNSEIISILCLNKKCYYKIKKILYKNILMKFAYNIDIKKHLHIWKILLNYNSIKKKYNYKSIKESISKETKENSTFEVIKLDAIRTSFSKNQKENQEKLCNVLKAISKELPSVNYCQGMNYITAFLLVLCEENEEDTFYLYLSILFSTDYCGLIVNDLFKLNSFFYSFERLLNIMIPEISNYFKINKIDGGFFLSPWFVTLFTNGFTNKEGNNNIKSMMRIFDLFLLSGWKSIFKIGISLIKNHSNKILSLSYDKLVHYLNDDIINSGFFKNENFSEIMNISINFKLSNNLINNLCKEFEMKKNIIKKNK